MFCFKCGKELIESASFCHYCGTNVSKLNKTAPVIPEELIIEPPIMAVIEGDMNETPQAVYESPTVDTEVCRQPSKLEIYFKWLFSQPMFLVTTILFSLSLTHSVISSLIEGSFTMPVLEALATISFWILFAAAKRTATKDNYIKPLKILSATALVTYILNWVMVGILALIGILMTIMPMIEEAISTEEFNVYEMALGSDDGKGVAFVVFGILFLSLAIGMVFANIFIYGKLKKFAKEFTENAKNGVIYTEGIKGVKLRLLISAAIDTVLSLVFYIMPHYMDSYEYLFGEYTIPTIDLVFAVCVVLLSAGSMVCLALCIKSPKAEQENIVDNSEKDDIIEIYS